MGFDESVIESYQKSLHSKELIRVFDILDSHPEFYPDVLTHISKNLNKFSEAVKKKNDMTLYNALSIACCMLSSKKRPSDKVVRQLSTDIKEAFFKNGPEGHAPGVKEFYYRFIKENEDEN